MPRQVFAMHDGLGTARRLPAVFPTAVGMTAAEVALLLFMGVVTAAVAVWAKLPLGLPGHNILRVIFPMALGLALVPRRGAASLMGLSATITAILIGPGRAAGLGTGAATSLALTGLLVDLALLGAKNGCSIYVRLTLAGLASNLAAMLVRGIAKMSTGGQLDGLPLELWWPRAAITYPLCGILAGLISALVWFRATAREKPT
jgi:hypothetical protein